MISNNAEKSWRDRVIERLHDLDMTKSDLARMIDVSPSRLGNYLHGTREPSLGDFGRIASSLAVTADWLLHGGAHYPLLKFPKGLTPRTRGRKVAKK